MIRLLNSSCSPHNALHCPSFSILTCYTSHLRWSMVTTSVITSVDTRGCSCAFSEVVSFFFTKGVMSLSVFPCYQTLPFAVCYKAVIIVSTLVSLLSSSTSVSKDNIGTEGAFAETSFSCVHQKLLARCPRKKTVVFPDYGHISGWEAH